MRRFRFSASSLVGALLLGSLFFTEEGFAEGRGPGDPRASLDAKERATDEDDQGDTRPSLDYAPLPNFPVEKPANDWRALAEITVALGAATVWYVLDDRNVFDWDFPSLEERFNGRAWRFDNNTFGINYLAHPLNGAGMWVLARGNRVGVWPTFGYTLLGSTLWEFAIEFQEKVSINDMIVTPGVGMAVGEFFHKFGWYLASSKPQNFGHGALSWTLGLAVTGHRAWDGRKAPPTKRRDSLGMASEMWHLFAWRYAFGTITPTDDATTWIHRWGFSGELAALPDYLSDKRMRGWFHEADFSRLSLDLELSEPGLGYDLFAEAVAAGYHTQTAELASTTGVSVAYILRNSRVGGYDDKQGLFLGPGLVTDLRSRHGGVQTHLRASAFPAFGSLSALSYEGWREQNPDGTTKTILGRAGYSFSQGLTGLLEAQIGWGPWLLEGRLRAGRHWSIEGLDRAQEEVEIDAPLSERVLEASAGLTVRPEGLPLEFGAQYALRRRKSEMGFDGNTFRQEVESQQALIQVGNRF